MMLMSIKLLQFSVRVKSMHLQNVKVLSTLAPRCIASEIYLVQFNKSHFISIFSNSSQMSSYNFSPSQRIHSTTSNWKSERKNQKKGSQKYADSDDEDDMIGIEDEEEGLDTKGSKVMQLRVTSLRTDTVLRSAFQIARNKIEKMFYESKIRVNGYKIVKKSHNVALGDEIDLIKGFSPVNPKFLLVNRVKILAASDPSASDDEESMTLKIRRYKSLTIDNYEEDMYKESSASDS